MKFAISAVVLLAVAMGVQSSVIPGLGLGIHGLGINGLAINGLGINGLGLGVNHLGLGAHGLGLVNGHGLGINGLGLGLGVPGVLAPGAWWGAPAAVNVASDSHGGVSVAHQASLVGPSATYVAKTRGAIHTAPLAGHINSVASANLAPAPGTW